jgi:hypothetical protein
MYHRSLIVAVPEPRSVVEDDLGLPLGQLVQVQRAGEPGDDLARDVDGDDAAEGRLVVRMFLRRGLADWVTALIAADQPRQQRLDVRQCGAGFRSDHGGLSGKVSSRVHIASVYHLEGERSTAAEERTAAEKGVFGRTRGKLAKRPAEARECGPSL